MDWTPHATTLAESATHASSRWRSAVARTPRHVFVPRWWKSGADGWTLCDGPGEESQWLAAAYHDASLVTSVGPWHADHAKVGDHPTGLPTSSSTLPSLVVRMFQHARMGSHDSLLDIGTGSGYGAALAASRLGEEQVTSVDVDAYLVEAARERLDRIGRHPTVETVDATGTLPGSFDRIVATVAVRPVPASWLSALKPGGRLVTTIAGTSLLITAEKDEDGGATGRVEWDRAGFMRTRAGADYPAGAGDLLSIARTHEGEQITTGRYPVVNVVEAWDLSSMLDVMIPGIEHHYEEREDRRVALMAHPDGSWARAMGVADTPPTIHQGGPRRLWDTLDELRAYWLTNGELPVRGARVFIKPDGTTYLARGRWHARL
ncbi:methyltransferase domain-containing protein [Streptomyces sp. URMC 124]|uniref:methyltransferase domain-containing protein n=1 Tax=Streptomyces sp. URMC 124 TaxID=3423405 RepID=UPI003F19937A